MTDRDKAFHEYYKPFWEAWDKLEKEELEKDLVREVLEHRKQAKLELLAELRESMYELPYKLTLEEVGEFLDTKQKELLDA